MPIFEYNGRGPDGSPVDGTVDALNIGAVASQLAGSGITPLNIEEVSKSDSETRRTLRWMPKRGVSLDELILFSRQMYSLLKAGVPITRAIRGLRETSRNPTFIDVLSGLAISLENGRPLSGALSQHPKIFNSLYISMIQVGETTGGLDQAFEKLSGYLEQEKETRSRIKSAMRYPTFVLIAITLAIGIINIKVIPAFKGVFDKFGAELPLATRILIGVSDFTVAYWVHILVIMVALIVGGRYYIGTPKGQFQWDRLKLRFPVVGDIILRSTLARFARTFAMSNRAGVPLLQGLTSVSRAVDNTYLGHHIQSMRIGVERGDSLTRTAAATNIFTPLTLQMLGVGEETGAVDDMLDEVGEFYEREVDYDLKFIGDAIEPILIIFVGFLVLILALGVFLPMWELGGAARR